MSDAGSDSSSSYESQPAHDVVYPIGVETEVPATNGMLHKTVLVDGTGTRPMKGSKVTVHYVGTLASDGSKFDSSRDRGEYFEFTIARGQVIKGWDVGVATMRVGEKAMLRCAPDYGYGASGSPPKIPANATLLFEVELFDWTKEEDISESKDKSIMKSTNAEGVDYEKPDYESTVTIDLRVFRGDAESGSLAGERTAWTFVVGEEPLPPALEKCLGTMRKKEAAAFRIAPAAIPTPFAPLHIAAGEAITYEVELHALSTVKTWEYKGQAKVDEGVRRKDDGNVAFKAGDLERAEKKYRRALEFVESDYGFDDEAEKANCLAARLTVWGNLSQVLLQSRRYAESIALCDKVLAAEPNNCKALFRHARAADGMNEWDAARRDLERLLEIDGGNADATQLLKHVQSKQREFDKKQRALYKNMFSA